MAGADQGLSQSKGTILFLSAIASGAIGGFLANLLTKFLVDGSGANSSIWIWAAGLLFAAIGAGWAYYWTVLGYGGFPKGSMERDRYNRLRSGLRAGGRVGAAYEGMLRRTLKAVDRFFRDADQAYRTLFPGAFGLKERAPLWTAPAYDRCLLLALLYPIAMLMLVWAASGHRGTAEAAIGLPAEATSWIRGLVLGGLVVIFSCSYLYIQQIGWRQFAYLALALIGGVIFAWTIGPVAPTAVYLAGGCLAGRLGWGVVGVVFGLGAVLVGMAGSVAADFGYPPWVALLGLLLGSIVTGTLAWPVLWAIRITDSRHTLGWFLVLWTLALFLIALAAPLWAADTPTWRVMGPVLLFLVLLTLVNAPFDWITLGLTRALLRRGLELGGWWPLVFGLIDLAAAAAVVAALAVATLWTVQLFEQMTIFGGGKPVIVAHHMLKALADPVQRASPEYWWLYAMLFSTLIPSMANVALGALSVMRGIPGLPQRLAKRMPLGKAVLGSDRPLMALVLAAQVTLSALVGMAAMVGLLWLILLFELPFLGLGLLSMLQSLAEADLPRRLLELIGLG